MPSLKLLKLPRRRPGSPSLKDRAAALKASAARVMRRGAPVAAPVISVPPAGADPRLVALVERCLDARRALNDPAVPDGPEAAALGERETDLLMEILRFPSRSAQDIAVKLPFLQEETEEVSRIWGSDRCPFEASVSGAAWMGLLRDIKHLADVTPSAEIVPNPVQALIGAPSQFERAAPDAALIALGREFDALHAAWRQAEDANREPAARRRAVEDTARAQGFTGGAFRAVEKVAWHLPGVAEACNATDAAFEALEPVSREIFATQAHTAAGMAIKARAVIPAIWGGGDYEEDAGSPHEDWDRSAVRQMIEAVCAAAGVDWRGQPVTPSEIQSKA